MKEDEQLSVVGRDRDRHRSRSARRIRAEAAHSRLGPEGQAKLTVNGEPVDVAANIERRLRRHPPHLVEGRHGRARSAHAGGAHLRQPQRQDGLGRVALKRGPFIYCAEQADNAVPVPRVRLPRNAAVEAVEKRDLFDGIVTLVASARAARADDWDGHLYRPAPPLDDPAKWTAIPYFLWNNREPGSMAVWIPEE